MHSIRERHLARKGTYRDFSKAIQEPLFRLGHDLFEGVVDRVLDQASWIVVSKANGKQLRTASLVKRGFKALKPPRSPLNVQVYI
ncbi:MAG: hypothetical protein ACK4FB_01535 [Brevundimonas sp.]|uniref:hypothetical protein n=1 Tax=Brevundimonas sp. TaxID=1871086 RepID=UPI00391B3933